MFLCISSWLLRETFWFPTCSTYWAGVSRTPGKSRDAQPWGMGAITKHCLWYHHFCRLWSLFSRTHQPPKSHFVATAGIKNRDERKPALTTLRLNEGWSKFVLLALSTMQCTLYSDNSKISGARLKNDLFRYQFSLWRKKDVTKYVFPHWICQMLNLLTLKATKEWKGICGPTSLGLAHTVRMWSHWVAWITQKQPLLQPFYTIYLRCFQKQWFQG